LDKITTCLPRCSTLFRKSPQEAGLSLLTNTRKGFAKKSIGAHFADAFAITYVAIASVSYPLNKKSPQKCRWIDSLNRFGFRWVPSPWRLSGKRVWAP